jgi:hypothetical protein
VVLRREDVDPFRKHLVEVLSKRLVLPLTLCYSSFCKVVLSRVVLCLQCGLFVGKGLAYQGKDIVFIFIIEYSSLREFGP